LGFLVHRLQRLMGEEKERPLLARAEGGEIGKKKKKKGGLSFSRAPPLGQQKNKKKNTASGKGGGGSEGNQLERGVTCIRGRAQWVPRG